MEHNKPAKEDTLSAALDRLLLQTVTSGWAGALAGFVAGAVFGGLRGLLPGAGLGVVIMAALYLVYRIVTHLR